MSDAVYLMLLNTIGPVKETLNTFAQGFHTGKSERAGFFKELDENDGDHSGDNG